MACWGTQRIAEPNGRSPWPESDQTYRIGWCGLLIHNLVVDGNRPIVAVAIDFELNDIAFCKGTVADGACGASEQWPFDKHLIVAGVEAEVAPASPVNASITL